MAGPLAGLKVVEMTGIGPCPLAGQLLADLGASVTVIDRKSGKQDSTDITRRGKRSIALDLKHPDGISIAKQLINAADVVIEGFRPGVMERLGLGPDDLDDHLIYGRITGWGQEGPLSQTAGHDINYLSLTGGLAAMGKHGEAPPVPLNFIADYGGGTMFLLFGVMAALYERQTSGKGQVIDAAMVDGVSAMMSLLHTMKARGMWSMTRETNLLDGGAPFYTTYKTSDGKFMSVGPLEPQFHALLVELAGLPTEHNATQMDVAKWPERQQQYAEVFASKTQAQWVEIFEGTDACVAPILTMDEAAQHAHNVERGTFATSQGPLQAAPAPRFSRSAVSGVNQAEAPGGAAQDLLLELGMTSNKLSHYLALVPLHDHLAFPPMPLV